MESLTLTKIMSTGEDGKQKGQQNTQCPECQHRLAKADDYWICTHCAFMAHESRMKNYETP